MAFFKKLYGARDDYLIILNSKRTNNEKQVEQCSFDRDLRVDMIKVQGNIYFWTRRQANTRAVRSNTKNL